MAANLVAAIWNGPFDAETPQGIVARGEQAMVTERDLESEHWQRVKPVKPARSTEGTD